VLFALMQHLTWAWLLHPLLLSLLLQGRKILEINPEHTILKGIKSLLSAKDEDRARVG
jgi:hypothetical protein